MILGLIGGLVVGFFSGIISALFLVMKRPGMILSRMDMEDMMGLTKQIAGDMAESDGMMNMVTEDEGEAQEDSEEAGTEE